MTIYNKENPVTVAYKVNWNGSWVECPNMDVDKLILSTASSGEDAAVVSYKYGIFVTSNGTETRSPVTGIIKNSYVRIKQGDNTIFIGIVTSATDEIGATKNNTPTGKQTFDIVGGPEMLRRIPVWRSHWIANHRNSDYNWGNADEVGDEDFDIDWIPQYGGDCQDYNSNNGSYQPGPHLSGNMFYPYSASDDTPRVGFGDLKALPIQYVGYYLGYILPQDATMPTFEVQFVYGVNNLLSVQNCHEAPVVESAWDFILKRFSPTIGLDFFFDYSGSNVKIKVFPAYAKDAVDVNTQTSTLDLESPLLEDFPIVRQKWSRSWQKIRVIGERIIFVDLLQGGYHCTSYDTNVIPLKILACQSPAGGESFEDGPVLGLSKFGVGDRLEFDWEKFQKKVTVNKNNGNITITNDAFPKQTMYLKTLDFVYDGDKQRHDGPVVTIGAYEYLRQNGGHEIEDDTVATPVRDNAAYMPRDISAVMSSVKPLENNIGIEMEDDWFRFFGGRDDNRHNLDITVNLTNIEDTVSEPEDIVCSALLRRCTPDCCYDTMTVTLAWESDQRFQCVFGNENSADEKVVYVPGANLVIVRGYMDADAHDPDDGTRLNPNTDNCVESGDDPVIAVNDFQKLVDAYTAASQALAQPSWEVSCTSRETLNPNLLGTVIKLSRGGSSTTTDCIVRRLTYSFPPDGSARTTVN